MGLGHVAGHGQQQRHRLLGGRQDVGLRGVDHHDTALGGGCGVDVVEADAGPAHHDEIGAGGEHLSGDVGGRADDERMGAHDGLAQLLRGQTLLHIDGVPRRAQLVETAIGDRFGDENACHRGFILAEGSTVGPTDRRAVEPGAGSGCGRGDQRFTIVTGSTASANSNPSTLE